MSAAKVRLFTFVLWAGLILIFIGGCWAAEFAARASEPKESGTYENVPDPRLGWVPKRGDQTIVTSEFKNSVSINSLHMNDSEWSADDLRRPNRILALGDSHTFAIGANPSETWPNQVELLLFGERHEQGVVLNAGVIGYSLGQYLERYRSLRETIRPTVVLIGFSTATDLYDLIPPERGGFVYGGDADRVFFDIGRDGKLLERVWKRDRSAAGAEPMRKRSTPGVREFLGERSALYRRLKRSKLAMTAATWFRPGGKSLWPGTDTALKIKLDPDDTYRWRLAELIIAQIASEARADGAAVALVQIPYLAQVYDDVWKASYGQRPKDYDRELSSARLRAICDRHGLTFIDTAPPFIAAARERRRWLHWPQDAHPTPEGHRLIAETVASNLRANGLVIDAAPLN